jgi:hypothetical protein
MHKQITEYAVDGKPLGRHVNHDPRSLRYPVKARAGLAVSQEWLRRIPLLDQGSVGSCVGNGVVGVLGTEPYYSTLRDLIAAGLTLDEALAVIVYSLATTLDPYTGQYTAPTWEDTGSDGLSGAKAAQQLGYINGYLHCLSLDAVITALQDGPVVTGVNWYTSFDHPDGGGVVSLLNAGSIRGGHEFEVYKVDMEARMFGAYNSWGPSWGSMGRFFFSFADYERLLSEDGDATAFVPLTAPTPVPKPPCVDEADLTLVQKATLCTRHSRPFKAWKVAKGL